MHGGQFSFCTTLPAKRVPIQLLSVVEKELLEALQRQPENIAAELDALEAVAAAAEEKVGRRLGYESSLVCLAERDRRTLFQGGVTYLIMRPTGRAPSLIGGAPPLQQKGRCPSDSSLCSSQDSSSASLLGGRSLDSADSQSLISNSFSLPSFDSEVLFCVPYFRDNWVLSTGGSACPLEDTMRRALGRAYPHFIGSALTLFALLDELEAVATSPAGRFTSADLPPWRSAHCWQTSFTPSGNPYVKARTPASPNTSFCSSGVSRTRCLE
eukprot:gene17207-26419_t